ncbi:MAG: ComF family protein [Bacteroidales bacterium]|nr:ComF family protein [Bacteroidales bacterium]
MIRELKDLLLPRECIVCGRQLGAREEQLCIWCAADLPLTYTWEQPHNIMADRFNATLERIRAPDEQMEYAYAASLLFYHNENPYKRIPQALKYSGNIGTGRWFSGLLGTKMAQAPHFADVDTVIPVPLHWRRKFRRGYNQAQVIAEELAKALGANLRTDVLKRGRSTHTQTTLDAEARLRNISGAFAVRHTFPAGHILLVDDTFTTGATLSECWITLRRALGPSVRISVATLAMVEA